ncbi:23 kDa integral membrane protein-like [Musca domestica]|uniref:Tetraspanin n=1 Tax=Musca domestica TaxID=7370 RepID=T1PB83_MUSDO|nr:23 kDa integral membrane protein [Musca domestica]XP_005179679.1 23 kDa integral membrane protein [Musca domestica]XP_011290941.1 23 kDa integral membrane protein [Musca domestica]XP_058976347.1 23 kDa integral membrane protein-like [Musca domestica]XP_058976348.1 23 kDa integral membrane protein-like [Musca domestica]
MDCGTTFAKYVLFIFNAIVSILGILVIVFGVLILNSIGMIEVDGQTGFPPQAAMPIGMITIGSIVVFISFLGCCGAIREDVCMTMCYAVLMLILLIIQLIVVVLLWTNQDKIETAMDNVIESAWQSEVREAGVFEVVQKSLKCCGVNSAADYALNGRIPPKSCCPADETCIVINYYPGCKKEARKFITGSSEKAKYFGLGLIVVELVGFIFACCLANNVRNSKRRNAY